MKFFLLRRFSHLIHRRTRSDSALQGMSFNNTNVPQSLSLGDLQQLGDFSRYPNMTLSTSPLPSSPDAPLLLSQTHHHPVLTLFCVDEHINNLRKENAEMELAHQYLKSHLELKIAELESYKSHFAFENTLTSNLAQIIDTSEKELYFLGIDINRVDDYYLLLLNAKICGTVFHRTRAAIATGFAFTDAIVDAIREVAEIPHSPWSTLIPPVIGERSPDHYSSALSITLKTRSDLRCAKNLAQFWKFTAQDDGVHGDIITPSASNLSEVQEVLSLQRQKAVDDLWSKLRSGELPLRSTVVKQAREDDTVEALASAHPSIADTEIHFLHAPTPSAINASALFISAISEPELTASTAASIITVNNASIILSTSEGSLSTVPSSGTSSMSGSLGSTTEENDATSPLPRLSLFSSDFWSVHNSAAGSSTAQSSTSESGSGDFNTEDALQSLEMIYHRFNNMKLDTIQEASPTCSTVPATSVTPPHSDADESSSASDADFVFVSIPTRPETPSPKQGNSILHNLNLASKITRRLSISLSPPSKFGSRSQLPVKTTPRKVPASVTPDRKGDLTMSVHTPTRIQSIPKRKRAASKISGVRPTLPADKRGRAATSPSSLSRPTISSLLKQSAATSPPHVTAAGAKKGNTPISTSSFRPRADSVSSMTTRWVTPLLVGPAATSLSPTKISRTQVSPLQHKRPPLPTKILSKGKENKESKEDATTRNRGKAKSNFELA